MYLFGFAEGLAGGSKETSYLTNYNTSHGTSRTTNYNTGWYTARTTSRTTSRGTSHNTTVSTSWNSVGNTNWNTTQTTSHNTSLTVFQGMILNADCWTVGTDCKYMAHIIDDQVNGPRIYCNIGFYYKPNYGGNANGYFKTANDGRLFLDFSGVSSSTSTYRVGVFNGILKFLNVWLDGVPRGYNDNYGANAPTYSEYYNATEIEVQLISGFGGTGLTNSKIKLGTRRVTNTSTWPIKNYPNFCPESTITYYDPFSNPQYRCISVPETLGGNAGITYHIPFGYQSTSWSTAGPMTYSSTTYTPSRNTTYSTDYSTSYGTSYGTSVYTSQGTSRGTSFTTTYGTSHTTDHVTYG